MPDDPANAGEYIVRCFRCLEEFDAAQSAWCSCLAVTPSLVCPHCLHCFCQAPHSYKTAFWAGAPQELFRRRQEHKHRTNGASRASDPSDPPQHPFVLVVEDEADLRDLASELLSELGYPVVTASNGEQGYLLATTLKPDMVLTDAVLPRMDGREMCLRIKHNPDTRETPVVIMSGIFTRETHKTEALRTFRADAFLRKPVSLKELGDVCLHLLGPSPKPAASS
jgi:CheY-like chemotaxis protein